MPTTVEEGVEALDHSGQKFHPSADYLRQAPGSVLIAHDFTAEILTSGGQPFVVDRDRFSLGASGSRGDVFTIRQAGSEVRSPDGRCWASTGDLPVLRSTGNGLRLHEVDRDRVRVRNGQGRELREDLLFHDAPGDVFSLRIVQATPLPVPPRGRGALWPWVLAAVVAGIVELFIAAGVLLLLLRPAQKCPDCVVTCPPCEAQPVQVKVDVTIINEMLHEAAQEVRAEDKCLVLTAAPGRSPEELEIDLEVAPDPDCIAATDEASFYGKGVFTVDPGTSAARMVTAVNALSGRLMAYGVRADRAVVTGSADTLTMYPHPYTGPAETCTSANSTGSTALTSPMTLKTNHDLACARAVTLTTKLALPRAARASYLELVREGDKTGTNRRVGVHLIFKDTLKKYGFSPRDVDSS